MSSAICSNLDQSKILSSGNGLFPYCQEFQILMMSRSDDGKTQLTPIRIQIVEINDRPIIDNISRSLEEGIGPVYFNYTIPIRVSDPDSGQSNGWGNITVTSPSEILSFILNVFREILIYICFNSVRCEKSK